MFLFVSSFRWQFTTDDYDIGFGVFKKNTGVRLKSGEMEEVLVSQRVNSHFIPEDGSLCCREKGICKYQTLYRKIHYI